MSKSPTSLNVNLILSFPAIPKYRTVAMEETVASDCSLIGTYTLEKNKQSRVALTCKVEVVKAFNCTPSFLL